MEEADKDWMMIRMVGGSVFILVPAHPGSPRTKGRNTVVMAALRSNADIILLPCSFYLLSFFPRLISAAADWMSTILPHMVWP